jgi:hypothetical protein
LRAGFLSSCLQAEMNKVGRTKKRCISCVRLNIFAACRKKLAACGAARLPQRKVLI